MRQLIREKDHIKCADLTKKKSMIDDNGRIEVYTGITGVYAGDEQTPAMGWLCRPTGHIWGQWVIECPLFESDKDAKEQYGYFSQIILSMYGFGPYRYPNLFDRPYYKFLLVDMTSENMHYVNNLTKEIWAMHKLSSDTLL